jgi:hypothetical protein
MTKPLDRNDPRILELARAYQQLQEAEERLASAMNALKGATVQWQWLDTHIGTIELVSGAFAKIPNTQGARHVGAYEILSGMKLGALSLRKDYLEANKEQD